MNRTVRAFFVTVALVMVFLVPAAFAQSANGGFHVVTPEGNRNVEFNAKMGLNGSASGEVKFSGPLSVPDQDVDGDGTGDQAANNAQLSLRVDVNCMKVVGNRAVLSGQVKESSVSSYVGRQMLLTVEDGGEGNNAAPDRYTWGQYRSTAATWTASDAELVFDPGVGLSWIASDFERTDDVGVPSNQSTAIDCKSFSLSSYALEDLPQGSGNVQVKP